MGWVGIVVQAIKDTGSAIQGFTDIGKRSQETVSQNLQNTLDYNNALNDANVKLNQATTQEKAQETQISASGSRTGVEGTNTGSNIAGAQNNLSQYVSAADQQKAGWKQKLDYESQQLSNQLKDLQEKNIWNAVGYFAGMGGSLGTLAAKTDTNSWFDQTEALKTYDDYAQQTTLGKPGGIGISPNYGKSTFDENFI